MIDKFVDTFKEESYELLGQLEQLLLNLEENPTEKEQISAVFRVMHTIKGSAAMFGFDAISAFAHEVEFILDSLREGKIKVSKKLIDLTLQSRDVIRQMLDSEEGELDSQFEQTTKNLIAELKTLLPDSSQKDELAQKAEEKTGIKAAKREETTFRIAFTPHEEIFLSGTKPLLLLKELKDLGDYTAVGHSEKIPRLSEFDTETCYVYWEVILTTNADRNTLKDVFIFVEGSSKIEITEVGDIPEIIKVIQGRRIGEILLEKKIVSQDKLDEALHSQKRLGEVLVEKRVISQQDLKAALEEQQHIRKLKEKKEAALSATSIRVSSEKLDQLVDLVGELVTTQARLTQTVATVDHSELTSLAEQIEHLTAELRDTAMGLRMLPIGSTFSKFARLVRDLSSDLGKEITMETEGAETELDKNVIEKLNDPLVHIIRNSIDHGIEPPAVRESSGKPRQGVIRLSAMHAGGSVVITIEDDGAGLDVEKIRNKAVEKNLIAADAELTQEQIYQLVFAPGFSTAKSVTSVSGRGVGMDVVKKEIESLRGSATIWSKQGTGTKITLSLPLTLAIIEGLLTRVGDEHFVLPLSSVEECIELTDNEERKRMDKNITNIRGEVLPYIRLKNLFKIDGETPYIEQIVVVNSLDTRIGIVVDQVIGDYQTVIKTLGPLYAGVEGVSGATILGDGSIALIADINRIVEITRRDSAKING